jgi:hypothetical protein
MWTRDAAIEPRDFLSTLKRDLIHRLSLWPPDSEERFSAEHFEGFYQSVENGQSRGRANRQENNTRRMQLCSTQVQVSLYGLAFFSARRPMPTNRFGG